MFILIKFNFKTVLRIEAQVTKLIEARSKAEIKVNEVYRDIDEAIEGSARKARVETMVGKAKDFV